MIKTPNVAHLFMLVTDVVLKGHAHSAAVSAGSVLLRTSSFLRLLHF